MFLYEFRCSDAKTCAVEFVYVIAPSFEVARKRVPKPFCGWGVLGTGKASKLSSDWDDFWMEGKV